VSLHDSIYLISSGCTYVCKVVGIVRRWNERLEVDIKKFHIEIRGGKGGGEGGTKKMYNTEDSPNIYASYKSPC
jgi:hypothetical protein